jgi:hypothetical protein
MSDTTASSPPPKGDAAQADKYVKKLVRLLNAGLIETVHTDLSKFDPSSLQDHYRIDLDDYQVEISHSKQADTGEDSFVMLFTNIKKIQPDYDQKVILAYTYISSGQFKEFKVVADDNLRKAKDKEERKQFEQAMEPIDQALNEISEDAGSNHHSTETNNANSADPLNSGPLSEEKKPDYDLDNMKPISQYSSTPGSYQDDSNS